MSTPDPMETTADTAEPEVAPLSPFPKRVLELFFSPGRVVDGLAAQPLWGAAMLLGIVLVILQTTLIPADVWEAVIREQMLARGQDPTAFQGGTPIFRILSIFGGAIGYVAVTFVFAGLITLVFAFVMGDEGRFKQYLALMIHAFLIPGILGLALVPLRIAQADPQLTLNVGTFLFFLPEGYILRWATMMDLTMVWAWLVVAQGAHAIDRRRSFASAAVTVMVLFVLSTALFALIPGTG